MFTIQELNAYSSQVRRKFAEKLASLPYAEVERNREASFQSMKNVLLHMIDNEDWMVNYVVKGRSADYHRRGWDEYADMHMVLEHLKDVEDKTARYLRNTSEEQLSETFSLTTSKGVRIEMSAEECLLQSFTEQLYHLGELIALLWQDDIEPPTMQWFFNNPRAGR